MSTPMTKTDANSFFADIKVGKTSECVTADFARTLERERNLWRNCAEAYRRSQTMKHLAAQDEIFDALEEQFPQL